MAQAEIGDVGVGAVTLRVMAVLCAGVLRMVLACGVHLSSAFE